MMKDKILLGQFFTKKNVFKLNVFRKWFESVPLTDRQVILEPFAGANNLVKLLSEADYQFECKAYDIEPKSKDVEKMDTISNFPVGFGCVITNPPYLSKNSATRHGLSASFGDYKDIYELSLSKCLDNCGYVAAIIPESFITTGLFKDRLEAVISLPYKDMFSDTEHPVCLALFGKDKTNDFDIYLGDMFLTTKNNAVAMSEILLNVPLDSTTVSFNVKNGNLGLFAVDDHIGELGMRFVLGGEISESEISHSSRLKTRIAIDGFEVNEDFVSLCNTLLSEYRKLTSDVLLTAFKGIRKDGKFRRRLSFSVAQQIIRQALALINASAA